MTNTTKSSPNVIVRLEKFELHGEAKVEIVAESAGLQPGDIYTVRVRTVSSGFQFGDFKVLKKHGLRPGGIVLLRRVEIEDAKHLSARSIETIVAREEGSFPTLLTNSAVCILPPKSGTMMVDRAYVVIGLNKSSVVDLDTHLSGRLKMELDRACQFGFAGVIVTGEDADGDVVETIIGGDQQRTVDEVIELFKEKLPSSIVDAISDGADGWHIAPFFQIQIDLERTSTFSAQRTNIEYGSDDELSWTKSNVVLRALGRTWFLADASSGDDVVKHEAGLLLDIIEE